MAHRSTLRAGTAARSTIRSGSAYGGSIRGESTAGTLGLTYLEGVGIALAAHVAAPLIGALALGVGIAGSAALGPSIAAQLATGAPAKGDSSLTLAIPAQAQQAVATGGDTGIVQALAGAYAEGVPQQGDTAVALNLPTVFVEGVPSQGDTGLQITNGIGAHYGEGVPNHGDTQLSLRVDPALLQGVPSQGDTEANLAIAAGYLEGVPSQGDTGLALSGGGLASYVLAQWDAASVSVTSTSVDSMNDEQTGGYDLTASGSARPTYSATGGPGGGPAVQFDGTDDLMQSGAFARNQPHAVVMTVSFIGDTGTFMDSLASQIFHGALSWSLNVYAGGGGSMSNGDQAYGFGWQTWVILFDGADSYIERNGASEGSGGSASAPGASNGSGMSLGGAYDASSHLQFDLARMTLVDATNLADVDTIAAEHGTDFGTFTP